MDYSDILEEELKNKISQDLFGQFDCTRIIGKIDFCVGPKVAKNSLLQREGLLWRESYLWAEAKKGKSDISKSLVQLILTVGKARTVNAHLPPKYLGAFDACQIAFLPYNDIQEIFYLNDFNWNVAPSNHTTKEFALVLHKVEQTLAKHSTIFSFARDLKEIQQFVKQNFVAGSQPTGKVQIDKNNFIVVYNKWQKEVAPSIAVSWDIARKNGIIDGDFYLADLLSQDNRTLKQKLFVVLSTNHYELDRKLDDAGLFSSKQTQFVDGQKAHTQFWNRYSRPPRKQYWDYIIERRDLLVPQDIRERKGSFFTPQVWVELSQQYLAATLGQDWQDEYTVWDCCAGTGNLLAGLANKYNIWASTVDQQDVDIMRDRISSGANLLQSHVFAFDFLNDNFSQLPPKLLKIITDEKKRDKLVIYINPPYAEATSATTVTGTGQNKPGVTKGGSLYHAKYKTELKQAANELFALFMARIYRELGGCHLAQFSKLKFIQGSNFRAFKGMFHAKFLAGFVMPANTFDNVTGAFPIGFTMWNLAEKTPINNILCDVYDKEGNKIGSKTFYGNLPESLNKWLRLHGTKVFDDEDNGTIGLLSNYPPDIQNNKRFAILSKAQERYCFAIKPEFLFIYAIYFAVRHCIAATWLNDRDQFLYPKDSWQSDTNFHNDCLAFTLFSTQNRISCKQGTNHWLPFTEREVNAQEKFASHFMADFMAGKLKRDASTELPNTERSAARLPLPFQPLVFSPSATEVFAAGRALWQYYHSKNGAEVNSSFYDIREHFQGRDAKGKMHAKSDDAYYNSLLGNLKAKMELLRAEIATKVYCHGFLFA